MKKILFISLLFLSDISFAQSTLPVIPFGQRKADLYYWDTNWIDRYEQLHPNSIPYPVTMCNRCGWYYDVRSDLYWGRACQANTPILVRGIAGMAKIGHIYEPYITIDTTNRLPEWFIMYDTNYNKLGEGRWDTLEPNYKMEVRFWNGRNTLNGRDSINVYEVYFDKPVLVSGRFYVGGTTHNNLIHGINNGDGNYDFTQPEHLGTFYPEFICNASDYLTSPYILPCNPPVALLHYYWPYLMRNPPANYTPSYDTSSFQLIENQYHFSPFFAIIDTNYVYYDCQRPTGLRVGYADEDSVTVEWDSASAEMWDVLVWNDGIEPDSGMHFTVQTNQLELTGLDTSLWYNIKVMALCDTMGINTSAWSNVFRLRVSDHIVQPCEVPEGLRVQPLQRNGVIVRWTPGGAGLWELALWREEGTDTTLMQSQVEYVEVDDLDTAVWYAVRLRTVCDSNNISEWTDTVRFFIPNWDTTGTEPIAIETAVDRSTHLMPNPTNDKVTVVSTYQLQKVELFGIDGKRIASYPADSLSAELDLSAYPSGTYIVRATTSAEVTTIRLVKK